MTPSSHHSPRRFQDGNTAAGIAGGSNPSINPVPSKPVSRAARVGWLTIALLGLAGCASQQPPPTEAVRARLGTVAVQAVQAIPKTNLVVPATRGQGAATGAWKGMWYFGFAALASGKDGGPYAVPIAVAMMPVGALTGAVAGGMLGTPKKDSAAAEMTLREAFGESDFQETVRREVDAAIRKNTSHPVARAGKTGPGNLPRADSLLEVNVLEANLEGSREKDARLALTLKVRVRLVSLPDGTELYQDTWSQRCGFLTFIEWGEPGAKAFERELVGASRAMADDIVNHVFLGKPSSKKLLWATPPKPGVRAAPKRGQAERGTNSGISSDSYHGWESQW